MLRSFIVLASALALVGCEGQPTTMSDTENGSTPPATSSSDTDGSQMLMATTNLEAIGNSGVAGTIQFEQDGETVTVTGEVTGLKPGMHGFHVHENGDLSDKETGKSAGGHFNPTDKSHGKPSDDERHVGDLGNIEANEEGVATVDITDDVISLDGENSIAGKALVIHAGEDQFTQPTGDAGDRVAFGLIEVQQNGSQNTQP